MKGKVYDLSKGFGTFITIKDVTESDIKADEIKIKQFLTAIGYKQRRDTKSKRSKLIRRMFASINEHTSQVISIPTSSVKYQRDTSDCERGAVVEEEEETVYESDEEVKTSGLSKIDPSSSVERLELLLLETK